MTPITKSIVTEFAQIIRGERATWEGDRRSNGYRFLTRLAAIMPKTAEELAEDISSHVEDFASETGVSPSTLRRAAAVLQGERQGSL